MTAEGRGSGHSGGPLNSRTFSGRPKKIIIATFLAVAILFVDLAVLRWAVPWAHEHYLTVHGSGGYVVVYFTVLLTLISSLALVAYVLQHDSYPSDRWQ